MENQADKSQEATPYKLTEARKKGQVGKSQEFVSMASLFAMVIVLILSLPKLAKSISTYFTLWLGNANEIVKSPRAGISLLENFSRDVLSTIGLILLAGVVAAVLASIIHVGPVFSMHPLKPDFT